MDMRIIRNRDDYHTTLAKIEALIDQDPRAGTAEAERLELLALLVEKYESDEFPAELPDPIEAIQFRMEQQDLSPRDLIPYLGSRSKVSEILAGKRPLTLSMMRALHRGLGIPAKVLLQDGNSALLTEPDIGWERFPLREMISRGWIQATTKQARESAEELVRSFFAPLDSPGALPALYRKGDNVRSARSMDEYALTAWTARILMGARDEAPSAGYVPGLVNPDFMRELVQLSAAADGPLRARNFLAEHGIALVIEPHLPQTFLDGAAMLGTDGRPVIGLTVRHDRIDNFWFTLLHEMAHIARHVEQGSIPFYDDLDVGDQGDPREAEADHLAGEALIPEAAWRHSQARVLPSPEAVQHLADQLGIHPAIVAGRVQHERKKFKLLHQMVGRGEVRPCFPDVSWK